MTMNSRADGNPRAPRQSGIDALRLLSVAFVVGAHAGIYTGVMAHVAPVFSKWSVPYFFIVLGYFLGKKSGPGRTSIALERTLLMFLIATLLLLPLGIARDGLAATWDGLRQNGLYTGSYFHLWYLNSLLWGLLLFRLLDTPARRPLMPWLALACLVASIALGSYGIDETRYLGRHVMSFPFLWLGTQLTRRVPTLRQAVVLALLGIGIEAVESWVLYNQLGRDLSRCPLVAGTVLYAVGMFGIAYHLPESPGLQRLGRLGARYSGGIYVLHLYALSGVGVVAGLLGLKQSFGFRLALIPAAFVMTLGVLRAADRLSPLLVDALLGSRAALVRLARHLARVPRSAMRGRRALPSRS